MDSEEKKKGKVYLVGAGPGDPGLLTMKGFNLIAGADCIVYDFLAPESLLAINNKAEHICAGKSGSAHTMNQGEINALLVAKAREGRTVVRLKGGDPFIFGRGGEEALALAEQNIEFEIVPGVSSAFAVPAYAGIPVTHRGMASSVSFITGHEDPTKKESHIDWPKVASMPGTLVFLMGVKNLPLITENLIRYGRSPDEAAALICRGTTSRQKTVTGTLETIAAGAREEKIEPPAILMTGPVVMLREKLAWYDRKPLFGRTFLVTRAREQAGALSERLINAGARVIEIPVIRITEPDDFSSLDESLDKLARGHYQWILFTSPRGVEKTFERLFSRGLDGRVFARTSIAAIGSSTAGELKKYGLLADLVPDAFHAEGLIEKMKGITGTAMLLLRAAEARDILPESLRASGNTVDIAVAYKTTAAEEKQRLERVLQQETIDMVTFTSSSTVSSYAGMLDDRSLAGKIRCASIGPVTSATAREQGFDVAIEAGISTIEQLAEEIIDYYRKAL